MASIVRGNYQGAQVELPTRPTITEDYILRSRDREWYVHQLQGWSLRKIARKYGVANPLVCRRLKAMPAAEKERLRRLNLGTSLG